MHIDATVKFSKYTTKEIEDCFENERILRERDTSQSIGAFLPTVRATISMFYDEFETSNAALEPGKTWFHAQGY